MRLAPRRQFHYQTARLGSISGLVFLALAASPCAAQEDPRERALVLFEEAAAAYDAGDFRTSVELLERAYELTPEPVIHYNLARAHEGLGELEDAIEHYQAYLDGADDIRDRGAIERRLVTLREQLELQQRLDRERREQENRDHPPLPVTPPSGRDPSAWPWVVVGLGVVGLGIGAGVGVLSQERREQADLEPTHRGALALFTEAEDLALAANITFGIAGTVALIGLIWGVVDLATLGDGDDVRQATLRLGPSGVSLVGRFR